MTMSNRRLKPVFDLAFNPADIKNRLTTIPIYVVAHKDDSEFVLVSGEVNFFRLHSKLQKIGTRIQIYVTTSRHKPKKESQPNA